MPPTHRLVLVLVDRLDLRAERALEEAWRIPAQERRALHVAVDEEHVWALADGWMSRRPALPLHMVENEGGVGASVRRVVEHELDTGFDEVVVLMGRLEVRSPFLRWLHDRTADAIAASLAGLPRVTTAVTTVALV